MLGILFCRAFFTFETCCYLPQTNGARRYHGNHKVGMAAESYWKTAATAGISPEALIIWIGGYNDDVVMMLLQRKWRRVGLIVASSGTAITWYHGDNLVTVAVPPPVESNVAAREERSSKREFMVAMSWKGKWHWGKVDNCYNWK